tara:strand:- start:653 stop:1012 length:360 start_codon:yes stop_codon:yes gene_type:complete
MNDVNKATAIEALVGSGVDWTYYHGEDRLVWNDKNVSQPTEEEILEKLKELENAEPMRLLRWERNRRLAETDYLALKDVFMTTDEELYRQQLRDITKGAKPKLDEHGNLINITWPVRPK